ncbi:hypothetical protein EC973_006286 [Apophysomyces ossiformis]|uniref:Uncharacterized protein n=1 Tax=Apophysomyces ossiformis TaxID=679940 RepID=A0A8H7ER60_9FUNG|nr:hypothetical protein EC973_006286 [Apophysomyces ossiformis]
MDLEKPVSIAESEDRQHPLELREERTTAIIKDREDMQGRDASISPLSEKCVGYVTELPVPPRQPRQQQPLQEGVSNHGVAIVPRHLSLSPFLGGMDTNMMATNKQPSRQPSPMTAASARNSLTFSLTQSSNRNSWRGPTPPWTALITNRQKN